MERTERIEFPTSEQVDKATNEQLARWYRFLMPETDAQQRIVDKVSARFHKLGGMTPELSRKIGHGGA
jgi:hypothetical protein